MKVFYKSKQGKFDAKGEATEDKFILFKGSRVSEELGETAGKLVTNLRKKDGVLDSKNVVKKDLELSSSSIAAQFVCGHSTNGLRAWKTENGKQLGDSLKGKGRREKKNG